ncbi:MAG: mevalonate kinase [Alkalispirochaeta sp.]
MSPWHNEYWAPGKLLLFGEHSAVFGYPAVGTALTRGVRLVISPARRMTCTIAGAAADSKSTAHDGLTAFAEFLSDRAPSLPPSHVEIVSDLPIAGGFGSSAALSTALAQWWIDSETGAVGEGPGDEGARPETYRNVWRRAHQLETFFHGTPSGIDTGLAALGGVQAFRFGPSPGRELPTATPLLGRLPPLVVGSIPRRRSTRELVAAVRRRHDENPATAAPVLAALGSLADQAITHLSDAPVSPAFLGEIASVAQEQLSALGVSSASLERILRAGIAGGALGGKLSGAGDGGAFFLVCPDADTVGPVHAAVRRELPPGGVAFVVTGVPRESDVESPAEVDVAQHRSVDQDQ